MTMEYFNVMGSEFHLKDPDGSTYRETIPGEIYEPAVTEILHKLILDDCRAFADVGALYGYFSVFAAKANKNLDVYAFEPCPEYCEVIDQNIKLNAIDRAVVCNAALSDKAEKMRFRGKTLLSYSYEDKPSGMALRAAKGLFYRVFSLAEKGTISLKDKPLLGYVPMISGTLSDLLQEKEIQDVNCITYDQWVKDISAKPSIIKIDVHGAEGKVLNGMKDSLRDSIKHIILEIHAEGMLVDASYEDIVRPLLDAQYSLYELDNYREGVWKVRKMRGSDVSDLCDFSSWSTKQKMMMRMVLASKNSTYIENTFEVVK